MLIPKSHQISVQEICNSTQLSASPSARRFGGGCLPSLHRSSHGQTIGSLAAVCSSGWPKKKWRKPAPWSRFCGVENGHELSPPSPGKERKNNQLHRKKNVGASGMDWNKMKWACSTSVSQRVSHQTMNSKTWLSLFVLGHFTCFGHRACLGLLKRNRTKRLRLDIGKLNSLKQLNPPLNRVGKGFEQHPEQIVHFSSHLYSKCTNGRGLVPQFGSWPRGWWRWR